VVQPVVQKPQNGPVRIDNEPQPMTELEIRQLLADIDALIGVAAAFPPTELNYLRPNRANDMRT
jgi:hypothetical protein